MSLANDDSAGKPATAWAVEEKADPLLTWLRRVRWVLGWSLFLIWTGVIAGAAFFTLGAFVMAGQLESVAAVHSRPALPTISETMTGRVVWVAETICIYWFGWALIKPGS